jgi:cytochrome c-type biogenesis protein CcmH/NrfG
MPTPPATQRRLALIVTIFALAALVAAIAYYKVANSLPAIGSPKYAQAVSAFYSGVIAMNVGDEQLEPNRLTLTEDRLLETTTLVPQEPAGWADLGLYQLRHDNDSEAAQDIQKAAQLDPNSPEIETYLGYLSRAQGDYAGASQHFSNAIKLDPSDLRARYALEQAIVQQAGPDATAQAEQQLQAILESKPGNIFVRIDLARLAADAGDAALLRSLVGGIEPNADWTSDVRATLRSVQSDVASGNTRQAGIDLSFLRNYITPTPEYQASQSEIQDAAGSIGAPIDHFLRLPSPPVQPAPPDLGMSFASQPLAPTLGHQTGASWAGSVFLDPDHAASVIVANGKQVELVGPGTLSAAVPFPGGPAQTPPSPDGVLATDWNNEFNVGLVLAGEGGVRIYRRRPDLSPMAFVDAIAKSGLPASVADAPYTGVWAVDIDSDGDLDLVMGAKTGAPVVLRNNADGTFTPIHPFPGAASGLSAFAWADFDHDGDPDAAFIDGNGQLHVFQNQRSGVFKEWPQPEGLGKVAAITTADVSRTGRFALVVLGVDGSIKAVTRTASGWQIEPLAQWNGSPADSSARLTWADLDNNGGLDLIATGSKGTQVWLSDQAGSLHPLGGELPVADATVDEQADNGRLDLVGIGPGGTPVRLVNHGAMNYNWQQIRLRSRLTADHRNNSYGIGGFVELRSGLVYAEQMVTQPVTHFGLGTYPRADAMRITWPNGAAQGEFELTPDTLAESPEQLIGSCPWLFAWDGTKMSFVTDFLWRSALGLRINAQNTAGVIMTSDWNKIRGDQLVPKGGAYELRLTTQLWESYFFDKIDLMAVDHPAGSDIWVDERFSIPPPQLMYRVMGPPHAIAKATDDLGSDVTDLLRARDARYLDTFGRGPYQGITRDHYVEIDLGPDFPTTGKQWLLCNGWIHPTDSSINMAISQGSHPKPTGVRVEVPDGRGGWRIATPDIGFPEGKMKTMLIPLSGLFAPGIPHRLRLRTNLELYWDWIAWATELPHTPTRSIVLAPSTADLHYHGFDEIGQPSMSSPEVPNYGRIMQTTQRWLDMTGFYTRYGDVRPLLAKIDDRYVIMNAGDELTMRFPALPPPASGWTRDFIIIGDGWGKDSNHNSSFSKTVLPLPYHADRFYTRAPTTLQTEPEYKAHKQDWMTYQTRYITPSAFQNAMQP